MRRDLLRRRGATLKKGDRFAVDDVPYIFYPFLFSGNAKHWLRITFFQAAPLVAASEGGESLAMEG
jgi:hypothetical protein